MQARQFDYVIVGGGSAGCVLANRLSADARLQVCLLEAGPNDWHPLVHLPLGIIWMMRSTRMNWRFRTQPEPALQQRRLFWPRGRVLGGSSASNAMCYTRGHAQDYDEWAALGNPGWGYADILPYFKRAEHFEGGADAYHGRGGPLHVSSLRHHNPLTHAFVQAGQQAGIALNSDFNGAQQEGVGTYHLTQRNGLRCSAAAAYLSPQVRARSNLHILTGAHATRIHFHGQRATAVDWVAQTRGSGAGVQQVQAQREVLLCAGALQSPQLLLLSGIGSMAELSAHGIAPVHVLPGVGQNLQDHLDVCLVEGSTWGSAGGLTLANALRIPSALWALMRHRRGMYTSNGAEAGGFAKTRPDLARPDVQLHFTPAPLRDHGRDLRFLMREGYSLHACQLRPQSRGFVGLHSADPLAAPRIVANYLSHPDDLRAMVEAVKLARRILQAPAFAPYRTRALISEAQYGADDAAIERFVRARAETIYHPVGTCKMGSDAMAVVDTQLRVHGVQGLRVVDASIMPTLISGNTNAPTIAIAEKAADAILQTH